MQKSFDSVNRKIATGAVVGLVFVLALATATGQDKSQKSSGDEAGFQSLFNGKDLSGWDGDRNLWSANDGVVTGRIATRADLRNRSSFLIWTNGTVEDFELRLLYRTPTNSGRNLANSGIQYRSKIIDPANWIVGGYQADLELGTNYSGNLYDEAGVAGRRMILAWQGEKVFWDTNCKKQVVGSLGKREEIQAAIKTGDWNEYVVVAKGNHLQHFINGTQTVDVTEDCESLRLASGVLALQLQANRMMTIQFKDIRLRQLK